MHGKFISNDGLIKLLSSATDDERLALTKLLDSDEENAYDAIYLQKEICRKGGHGVANWLTGEGAGYLHILADVADALEIPDRKPYYSSAAYFDQSAQIIGDHDADVEGRYKRQEATKLGLEYASNTEEKIIIALIKKCYESMMEKKDGLSSRLLALVEKKSILSNGIDKVSIEYNSLKNKRDSRGLIEKLFASGQVKQQIETLEGELEVSKKQKRNIESDIQRAESELQEVTERIDEFDNTINEVSKEFDVSHVGKLTGTAGIMVLANLGGFATYTFLTSMMSVLSMGTLGFGAYTAATSLLSILIGPVGWAGLGIFALFSFAKPKMSELMPIVATIGAIRQRVKYG